MLEDLLHINPALYNQLIKMLKEYCRHFEKKYKAEEYSFGFRAARPDDLIISGTYNTYTATYPNDIESNAYIGNGEDNYYTRVPTNQAAVYFGWKCKVNLGQNGYLSLKKEGVILSKLQSSIVYEQQYPQHTYHDIQKVNVFREQDRIEFKVFNASGLDVFGEVYPILYIIAHKRQLNLLERGEMGNEIAWKNIDDNIDNIKENKQINKIESMISEMKDMYKPFEYIKIKDSPFSSHTELKTRLDPSMKNYLENLKKGKVCKFCGELIYGNSIYCFACGCPIDNAQEKEKLHNELDAKV